MTIFLDVLRRALRAIVEECLIGRRYIQRVKCVGRLGKVEVALVEDIAFVVGEQHGYIAVALDYAQKKVDVVGCRIWVCNLSGSIGPYLHPLALLFGEFLDNIVGYAQK